MSYLLTYDISYKSMQIIKTLGIYRGMTAKQLASMIYAPVDDYTLSDEKSVYNFLGKLKKQGLVLSYKLQVNVAPGSMYYLSANGYELFKEIVNVELGHYGDGWIESYEEYGDFSFGDLSYELYKPPLGQAAHHLLLVEFFIKVKQIEEGSIVDHRLNLYAAQTYYIDKNKYRFRPDGEIWLRDIDFRYTIEIDRGTEDFIKLQEKFEVYKRYFDYLKAKGREAEIPKGIIFVAESKRRMHGIKRRWATILKAFWSKLFDYSYTVNLIYTTMDQVENTLTCEMKRLEKYYTKQVSALIESAGFPNATTLSYVETGLFAYTITKDETSYQLHFCPIVNEYESLVYTRWLTFKSESKEVAKEDIVKGLKYKGTGKLILYCETKPFIFDFFELFELDQEVISTLNMLGPNLTYKQI